MWRLKKTLESNRIQIDADLKRLDKTEYFSPLSYLLKLALSEKIQIIKGDVIDIGCGTMPYKKSITASSAIKEYTTIDIEKRDNRVDIVGDVQNMNMVANNAYDTIICTNVLEHIPNPFQAMDEIYRIARPNGVLILSVPHLSRLHEEPNDFYRYTKYGLEYIINKSGFNMISITPVGGLVSFVGHQLSSVILCSLWHIPLLRQIAFVANKWIIIKICISLDKYIDRKKIFAAGYVCVAKK